MRLRTKARAASAGTGRGRGRSWRSHQSWMADLRMMLGMTTSGEEEEEDEEKGRSRDRSGGATPRSAQASTHLRSKVHPVAATTTGSAMTDREMGHRNSTGGSTAAVVAEEEGEGDVDSERWEVSLQRPSSPPISLGFHATARPCRRTESAARISCVTPTGCRDVHALDAWARHETTRLEGGEGVERVAASPDLALAARLHPKHADLLHGVREVPEKGGLVGGVELHKGLRPRVRHQRLVRRQQPQPPQQVLVVQVVELARRHHVVEGGDGRVRGVVGTRLLQRLRELRVHRRVVGVPVAAVVAVDARRELVAVREADGVGAGEGHQLLCGEALPSEEGDELVHGHVGAGELALDGGGGGVEGVLAAEADVVERPAQHDEELAGGEGEDVGAGDHAGALKLEGCLGADDDVAAILVTRARLAMLTRFVFLLLLLFLFFFPSFFCLQCCIRMG
ncbi:hypothetical protein MUK42_33831 [Musa troglodytarum]|uniref:Uncharacterized protein n=1 Tax=Musa troglodytarum TaxID=320322 RepID=A0A9E7L1A3_9LILI|nr:hypothetical protein MUK42_33831 [Musa troglodytarum]